MQTVVVDHPIVRTRLTVMRDERSSNAEFRAALRELATLLVYEATRQLAATDLPLTTPVGPATGSTLANPPLLVPVLRAGLGMAEAAFNLLPESQMGFVGLARRREDPRADAVHGLAARLAGRPAGARARPDARHRRLAAALPASCWRRAAPTTSPWSARWPLRRASPGSGPAGSPTDCSPPASTRASNANAYIVPGLGDAGDRQFGPR